MQYIVPKYFEYVSILDHTLLYYFMWDMISETDYCNVHSLLVSSY